MAQLINYLLYKHKDPHLVSQYNAGYGTTVLIPALEWTETGGDLWTSWPASLAELVSSRLSEREKKNKEEGNCERHTDFKLYILACSCTHL